jgi:BCD family chlorophyll transporter-like MFS transporter
MRDAARGLSLGLDVPAAANGYVLIFALELALMAATLAAMWPLLNHDTRD